MAKTKRRKTVITYEEIRRIARAAGLKPAANPKTPCVREGCGREALVHQALRSYGMLSVLHCPCGNISRKVYKRKSLSVEDAYSRSLTDKELADLR